MSARDYRPSVPAILLTPERAAAALDMSADSFNRHVRGELRLVRRGRLVLVPVSELERWAERNAAATLEDGR